MGSTCLDCYEVELRADRAPCARILATLPPVPDEPERVIRCSPSTVERACCRAWALALVHGELWRVEIHRDADADSR